MSKTLSTMINTVMKTVMSVPRICGTITFMKIWNSLAPSIRAASRVSSGTDLIADDSKTIANPVCSQIRMTISSMSLKLNCDCWSHGTGTWPSFVMIALSRPICVSPSGLES